MAKLVDTIGRERARIGELIEHGSHPDSGPILNFDGILDTLSPPKAANAQRKDPAEPISNEAGRSLADIERAHITKCAKLRLAHQRRGRRRREARPQSQHAVFPHEETGDRPSCCGKAFRAPAPASL